MSTCTEGCFRNVINLGNSIIGVSILAMPYCFQKCGILLSLVLIMASGLMTKASCHLLLKAAIMARRRNFEFLAFHTFGTLGKFAVELSIIGFLLGTCIAFFVVIGDLSPPIAAEIFLLESTARLRVEVLMFLGFFIALPLGLLRKLESLTSFSFLSVTFYIFLGLKILGEALPNLSSDVLWNQLHWWRPSGLLSTLPIFFMALSCQTQLFEIFDILNEPSLKRMDTVVSSAVHMCSCVYSVVGIFGYIAFYDQNISGNILVKLSNSGFTEVVKIAFVVTVIISFPLCLFPCRSSLHSLIYKQGVSLHDLPGVLMIPDHRFRILTFGLVSSTICAAILLPNIEFVLGILGSTIGTVICFILPALIFIKNTMKNTNERILAQAVFCIGVFILVVCSYSTLHESKSSTNMPLIEPLPSELVPPQRSKPFLPKESNDAIIEQQFLKAKNLPGSLKVPEEVLARKNDLKANAEKKAIPAMESSQPEKIKPAEEKRQEPPVPQEPEEQKQVESQKKAEHDIQMDNVQDKADNTAKAENKKSSALEEIVPSDNSLIENNQNDLHPDAIKKEDKEIEKKKSKDEKESLDEVAKADKQEELLRKIEAQQQEQKKLLEEQRQLLQELKEHKESHSLKSSVAPPPPQQGQELKEDQKHEQQQQKEAQQQHQEKEAEQQRKQDQQQSQHQAKQVPHKENQVQHQEIKAQNSEKQQPLPALKPDPNELGLGKENDISSQNKAKEIKIPKFLPQVSPKVAADNKDLPVPIKISQDLKQDINSDSQDEKPLNDKNNEDRLKNHLEAVISHHEKSDTDLLKPERYNIKNNSHPNQMHIQKQVPLNENSKNVVPKAVIEKDGM